MSKPTMPAPATLRGVFEDLKPDAPNIQLADDAAISTTARQEAGIVEWAAASSLVPHIAELLNVPLPDVLVLFWQQTEEVAAEIEESKRSPGPRKVTLLETKTQASYEPSLEIRLNGAKPGKQIGFKVVMPITLKGATLVIEDGRIADVVAGEGVIEGAITLGKLTIAKLKNPLVVTLPSLRP